VWNCRVAKVVLGIDCCGVQYYFPCSSSLERGFLRELMDDLKGRKQWGGFDHTDKHFLLEKTMSSNLS